MEKIEINRPDYDRLTLTQFQYDAIERAIHMAMSYDGKSVNFNGADFIKAFEILSPERYSKLVSRVRCRYYGKRNSK